MVGILSAAAISISTDLLCELSVPVKFVFVCAARVFACVRSNGSDSEIGASTSMLRGSLVVSSPRRSCAAFVRIATVSEPTPKDGTRRSGGVTAKIVS